MICPHVNIDAMNAFLEQFGRELPADVHAVMALDRAGWHTTAKLTVPANVTLMHLPPKSPELNPVENLWHYLRSHFWSNRHYPTWDELNQAATDAWRTAGVALKDCRIGTNIRHSLTALLRQSVYSRLAGYDDVNHADRLAVGRCSP